MWEMRRKREMCAVPWATPTPGRRQSPRLLSGIQPLLTAQDPWGWKAFPRLRPARGAVHSGHRGRPGYATPANPSLQVVPSPQILPCL